MKGIVIKPIPGTGYSIGEEATFDKESAELFAEFLTEEYLEVKEAKEEKKTDKTDKK